MAINIENRAVIIMTNSQKGVAIGAGSAIILMLFGFYLAVHLFGDSLLPKDTIDLRLAILALAYIAPAIALLFFISRLAIYRFFSPQDINGSGLTEATKGAKILQAVLQNTLEQAVFTGLVYFICAFWFPPNLMPLIIAASIMFFIGRIAFFIGYPKGAPYRAFGFGFTFFPTTMLFCVVIWGILFP